MSKRDGVSVSLKSGISLVGYKSKSFVNCHIKLGKSWGEHELHMLVGIYFMRIKNLMVKARRSMNSEVVLADRVFKTPEKLFTHLLIGRVRPMQKDFLTLSDNRVTLGTLWLKQ